MSEIFWSVFFLEFYIDSNTVGGGGKTDEMPQVCEIFMIPGPILCGQRGEKKDDLTCAAI